MKECFHCWESKPLTEFYKHSQMADGHLNKCKACVKAATEDRRKHLEATDPQWTAAEAERQRVKAARHRAAGTNTPTKNESKAAWRKRNPEKASAHRKVSRAIKAGKLVRQPCEVCQSLETHAHHDDYSKPLDVRWLCPDHHGKTRILHRLPLPLQ